MFVAFGIGLAGVVALMLVLWLAHLRTGNASIVDPGWAGGLALIAVIYGWLAPPESNPARVGLITGMAAIWGVRLSLYLLLTRVIGHPEEGRYVELRRAWGGNLALRFLIFFEFQALLCAVLSLPFLLAVWNPAATLHPLEWAGVAVWLTAFCGELLADWQLHQFKQKSGNRGKTCRDGLWNYSRHPNYFFEWLIWVAFALFASASPDGYWSWICPALMLYFLFRVTGIPATEAQALRTRGDDYREYQRTTSAFVPWFPNAGGERAR